MKLSDVILPEAIVPVLKAAERDDVVVELVDALIGAGAADSSIRDELIAAVLEREQKGSTGFGRGVAVPHVKHQAVNTMTAAIGPSTGTPMTKEPMV